MRAGWRQTVQQLVDRFKESFVPVDDNGDLTWPSFESADFDANNRDDRQRAEAHKLTMAAQDASQNSAQLVKLRQHFQKVSLSCLQCSSINLWVGRGGGDCLPAHDSAPLPLCNQ